MSVVICKDIVWQIFAKVQIYALLVWIDTQYPIYFCAGVSLNIHSFIISLVYCI